VNVPPTITAQPVNQTVVAGETATFSVTASGSGQLSYQWLKNGVGIFSRNELEVLLSNYTTPATTLSDSGEQFAVIVTDPLGKVTSNTATLTVLPRTFPATYYVDFASGSDENSGVSKDSPWQYAPGMYGCSFNCSSITLNPGDRVIFKGGVTWDSTSFPMVVLWSGSIGAPIYYGVDKTWFAGASWARPVFDLGARVQPDSRVFALFASFITFDNLEIKNERTSNSNSLLAGSITVYGGTSVTIENCYIHGWSIQDPTLGSDENPFGGITFYNNSNGGIVKNCILDGAPASNSGTGIYGGTTIQGNIVENVPNGIVVFDPAANVSGNQVFNVGYSVDPTVVENSILVSGGGQIYNNVVHDIVPAAFAIHLQSAWQGTGNTQYIYNNLIWNVGSNAPVMIDPSAMTANLQSNQSIFNNTLNGGSGACISVMPAQISPTNLTVENNHCISDQTSLPAWCWNAANGNAGCGTVANLTFTNNVLMTTALALSQGYTIGNSFEPTSLSAGTVGAGLNLSVVCVSISSSLCSDRLGVGRSGGSTMWDAGAYLYQPTQSLAPSITVQPASQTVQVGQAATFNVVAAGSMPLNYQWQENGANIPGAISSSYTTPATTGADSGSMFDVIVTNTTGTVTSSTAALRVNPGSGQLTASTVILNFGNVAVGSNSTLSLTLSNSSPSTVTILKVSISGPGFDTVGSPNGLILGSGQTTTLYVTFSPSAVGGVTGSLIITSDAANSSLPITLSGSGTQPASNFVRLSWTVSTSSAVG
jgi:putative cofactor-binding repeat protein